MSETNKDSAVSKPVEDDNPYRINFKYTMGSPLAQWAYENMLMDPPTAHTIFDHINS